jgi:hypothetical protein
VRRFAPRSGCVTVDWPDKFGDGVSQCILEERSHVRSAQEENVVEVGGAATG